MHRLWQTLQATESLWQVHTPSATLVQTTKTTMQYSTVYKEVTLAVTADDELRVHRIMNRDNISEEYARKRVAAQKPSAWFEEHCDYTIQNNGSDSAEVEREAYQLFNSMINKEVI